jgi:hypothetical protein
VRALAFDTRYPRSRWITGSAASEIGKLLRRMGCKMLAEPESFFVKGAGGPLELGGRTVPGRLGRKVAGANPAGSVDLTGAGEAHETRQHSLWPSALWPSYRSSASVQGGSLQLDPP